MVVSKNGVEIKVGDLLMFESYSGLPGKVKELRPQGSAYCLGRAPRVVVEVEFEKMGLSHTIEINASACYHVRQTGRRLAA